MSKQEGNRAAKCMNKSPKTKQIVCFSLQRGQEYQEGWDEESMPKEVKMDMGHATTKEEAQFQNTWCTTAQGPRKLSKILLGCDYCGSDCKHIKLDWYQRITE